MHSRTKRELKQEELSHIIKESFNDGVKIKNISELNEGWYNMAYSISLNNSQEVILKVAPPPEIPILTYESDLMKTEVAVFKLLNEKTQVPVPNILFKDFTHKFVKRDYYIMEKLQGKPWNHCINKISKEENDQIWSELGRYCAQINSLENENFGYFNNGIRVSSKSWGTTFSKMIELLLLDAERLGAELPILSSDIQKLVQKHILELYVVKTPKLIHWDLWEGNVFVKSYKNTFKIEGIIDCERSLYGDPVMDVPFNIAMHHASERGRHPFLEGYAKECGKTIQISENFKIRRNLYNVYLYLVMLIESKSRQYKGPKANNILRWARKSLVETYQNLMEMH